MKYTIIIDGEYLFVMALNISFGYIVQSDWIFMTYMKYEGVKLMLIEDINIPEVSIAQYCATVENCQIPRIRLRLNEK